MIVVVDCNIIVLVMFFWISPNTNIIMIHPNDETKKTPSKIIIFICENEVLECSMVNTVQLHTEE